MAYREFRAPAALESSVACLWVQEALHGDEIRVVPDGCVDLMWFGEDLVVVGADTGPVVWNATPAVSGLRLRTGAAGAVLGVPASEVCNQMVALSEIWPQAREFGGRRLSRVGQLRVLATLVEQRGCSPDPLVTAATKLMRRGEHRVGAVANDLGVSERHLQRRVNDAVGYGPKTLSRVIRFRRFVSCMEASLADRAHLSGYASQSHMTDEIKSLTDLSPVRFLEDVRVTAA